MTTIRTNAAARRRRSHPARTAFDRCFSA